MAIFTKEKLDKIAEIVRRHVDWFLWRVLGDRISTVTSSKIDVPVKVANQLPASVMHLSFILGEQEALLKESEWSTYEWGDLKEDAKIPLTELEQLQVKAAELSAYSAYRRLGDDIVNGLYRELANVSNSVVSEGQVRGIIKDKVKFGVKTNRAYFDVAKDLVGSLKEQKRNWYRVASTEMHRARQLGVANAIIQRKDVYRNSKGIDSLVTVVPAPTACEDCRRLYLGKDGNPKIFKITELLENAGTNYQRPWRKNAKPVVPPVHPNSIAGYATVEGNTIAATRMSYVGQIREIKTASGHTLPVTPNHPVATTRGFIPACQVQEGDYLLSYNDRVKDNFVPGSFACSTVFSSPQNSQYGPTSIEQAFHSLSLVSVPLTVRRFGDEFHGDAAYGDSDIDIVYVDSKLRDSFEATFSDQVNGLLLETAKLSAFAAQHMRLGNSLFVGNGINLSSSEISSVERGLISSQPSQTLCFGSTAWLDSMLLELRSQFNTRDSSFCGELQQRLSCLVTKDQVVNVRDFKYSGHVYDLQTVSGVIVAENLIVSNCFCRLRYVSPGWGWDKEGRFTLLDPEAAFGKKKG